VGKSLPFLIDKAVSFKTTELFGGLAPDCRQTSGRYPTSLLQMSAQNPNTALHVLKFKET
jgi:hypothetical protein